MECAGVALAEPGVCLASELGETTGGSCVLALCPWLAPRLWLGARQACPLRRSVSALGWLGCRARA